MSELTFFNIKAEELASALMEKISKKAIVVSREEACEGDDGHFGIKKLYTKKGDSEVVFAEACEDSGLIYLEDSFYEKSNDDVDFMFSEIEKIEKKIDGFGDLIYQKMYRKDIFIFECNNGGSALIKVCSE